jgi:elongation factor 2
MPKQFTVEELRSIMSVPLNIRNISIIAHVDHGKTTLTDSLIAGCGIIPMEQAGEACATDSMKLEKEKGITIKSTGISLFFDLADVQFASPQHKKDENSRYIINLVDSPGHVDFSSEVTAALQVTDGALVIVDCVEGVCVQTETVMRQALTEKIKPVLCINKLDRAFLELKLDPEEMYQSFQRIIEVVNCSVSTFGYEDALGDLSLSPEKGNIAFCAGKQGWSFTLNTFARLYAKKFGISESKLLSKLWGDNYWDDDGKEWTTSSVSKNGKKLTRAFCKFVLEPIQKIFDLASSNKKQEVSELMQKIGVQLKKDDREKEGKDLIKACMQTWLPAHLALVEMIVTHLPSPVAAQKYRVMDLYEGPQDDNVANAIRKCDPNGPLMVFISKLIQDNKSNKFVAFGRVFSGTARAGMKVRIMNNNYIPGSKENIAIKSLQRTLIMMGKNVEAVDDVPCGNTIGVVGVDDAILKTATITDDPNAFPFEADEVLCFTCCALQGGASEPRRSAEVVGRHEEACKSRFACPVLL